MDGFTPFLFSVIHFLLYMKKHNRNRTPFLWIVFGVLSVLFVSCSSGKNLVTSSVGYQSVRTTFRQPVEIPDDAEIVVAYGISADGVLIPVVENKTSEIMIIDQTMSFFVNTDGNSTSYYDPTVRTTEVTDHSSNTKGTSVNLGAVAGFLGIGGKAGSLLSGVNVGNANTEGTSISNVTTIADQPRVSLAPKSKGQMSKSFQISGIGRGFLNRERSNTYPSPSNAPKFSVCVSYSLDGGTTFKKIVSDFYVNSDIVVPVRSKGKVNNSLRTLFTTKPDAMDESWWLLYFNNNVGGNDTMCKGVFVDYQ